MTGALAIGAGFGLGAFMLARGLWPGRPSLAAALAPLRGEARAPAPALADAGSRPVPAWRLRLGRWLAAACRDVGIGLRKQRRDLDVVGRTVEELLAEKALAALLAPLLVAAMVAALALAGLHLPFAIPVWAALLFGTAGFFVPDLALQSQARERRLAFRHTTASFLDLVATNLAGGTGVEGALYGAARAGQGWAFTRIREALDHARFAGETPWAALGQLGVQLDVAELRELAASLLLAGNEGAKVRQSLSAKATSLRRHQLADAEREAAQATERMTLPVALLLVGFLVFLGYPAVVRVFSS